VHARAATGEHRGKKPLEDRVIGRVREDWLACIAALDDVVNAARHVKSGSA
jgi:hypothetical protein